MVFCALCLFKRNDPLLKQSSDLLVHVFQWGLRSLLVLDPISHQASPLIKEAVNADDDRPMAITEVMGQKNLPRRPISPIRFSETMKAQPISEVSAASKELILDLPPRSRVTLTTPKVLA